ncbi:unnamed protein product [Acanthoscelides obtectus]|uniref:Uncharacterized protein n=1 Tax=Acanthoscelides obtectus TaxID=200917 RepID=A0A9P0K0L8_ACAOB|nr:unnamed protein product [Acanthoscelides obtectus]CAK1633821.1 hypothetical protein AOBTE_LOCUS8410 [Acanthoscelides obtectus]
MKTYLFFFNYPWQHCSTTLPDSLRLWARSHLQRRHGAVRRFHLHRRYQFQDKEEPRRTHAHQTGHRDDDDRSKTSHEKLWFDSALRTFHFTFV